MSNKESRKESHTEQNQNGKKVVTIDGKKYIISPVHPDLLKAARESNRRFFEELDKQDQLTASEESDSTDPKEQEGTKRKFSLRGLLRGRI